MAGPTGIVDTPAQVRQANQGASEQLNDANNGAQNQLATRPYPAGASISIGPGLLPKNLEDAARFAQLVHKSEFIPKAFRDKAGDVLAAVMFGLEIGLPPMQALQTIAVINGRPSVYGDGLLAVVYSLSTFVDHDEFYEVDNQRKDAITAEDLKKDNTCAVCIFTRRGRSKPVIRKFSVAQAKTANLWTKDGPWKQYPDRMLMFRARGFAARDAFPDGMRGIISAEEANDIPGEVIRSEVVMPERISEHAAGPVTHASTSEATSAHDADAPRAPEPAAQLPEGLDRIVAIQKIPSKNDLAKFWWKATTERGVNFFTLVGSPLGPTIDQAHAEKATVKLSVVQEGSAFRLLDIAIIDGTTGEQKS